MEMERNEGDDRGKAVLNSEGDGHKKGGPDESG
jgi:hypothetical protein